MPISKQRWHFWEALQVYSVSTLPYSTRTDSHLTLLGVPNKRDWFEAFHTFFRRMDKRYRKSMYQWTKLQARSWNNQETVVCGSWAAMQTSKQSKNNVLEARWQSHFSSSIVCCPVGIVRRVSTLLFQAQRCRTLRSNMTTNWDRDWLRPC